MNKTLMIIIAVVVIFAGIIMSGYNSLVSMNENVNGKWSQVENQLQRRNDLIPNLVNTVKGYAAHESDVFKAVSDAAENYPDLKANTNFLQLQDELAGTENRIAVARMDYNGAVQGFNAKIKSFPTVLYAGMFGFDARDYFKADESAKTVPQVQF